MVATPIFGAGVALRAKIVPVPNIAKCGTLCAILTTGNLNSKAGDALDKL